MFLVFLTIAVVFLFKRIVGVKSYCKVDTLLISTNHSYDYAEYMDVKTLNMDPMEKGMCLFEIINFHVPRFFLKATSLIHGLFSIKVQRFVSISTSTKNSTVNSYTLAQLQKKHGLPRCFGSTELHIIMEGLMA